MLRTIITVVALIAPAVSQSELDEGSLDSCGFGAFAVNSPDLAYDEASDVYAQVWHAWSFGCTQSTLAKFYDGTGVEIFSRSIQTIWLDESNPASSGTCWSGRVANIRARGVFVIAWGWFPEFSGTTSYLGVVVFDAATQSILHYDDRAAVNTGAYNEVDFHDIGGDQSSSGDSALIVFGGEATMSGLRVTVDASGSVQVGSPFLLRTSPGAIGRRAISSDAGEAGRHLIVFEETYSIGDTDVRAMIVDRNDQIIDDGPIVESAVAETMPHVDGDGRDWLVAYRNEENGLIHCNRVTWNTELGTAWAAVPSALPGTQGTRNPVVAAIGDSYSVSLMVSTDAGVVVSLDASTCTECESFVSLPGGSGGLPWALAVADGRPTERLAVVGGSEPLLVLPVRNGETEDLGGGCGAGGRARAHCAVAGNGNFVFGLTDAQSTTPAFLALSAGRLDLPCAGGCVLVPDVTTGLVVSAGSTSIVGGTSISAPMPNDPALIGAELFEQWLLFTGTGCFGSLALSSSLSVRIQ